MTQRWEYYTQQLHNKMGLKDALNIMGQQCWELVQVLNAEGSSQGTYVFKRSLDEKPDPLKFTATNKKEGEDV